MTGVLTPAAIARWKAALRLSPDQEPLWQPVEPILREIGQAQMAQIQAGQKPEVSFTGGPAGKLPNVAMPLYRSMRDDQKVVARAIVRSMGYGHVASMI